MPSHTVRDSALIWLPSSLDPLNHNTSATYPPCIQHPARLPLRFSTTPPTCHPSSPVLTHVLQSSSSAPARSTVVAGPIVKRNERRAKEIAHTVPSHRITSHHITSHRIQQGVTLPLPPSPPPIGSDRADSPGLVTQASRELPLHYGCRYGPGACRVGDWHTDSPDGALRACLASAQYTKL
jgi:hypothetical protein